MKTPKLVVLPAALGVLLLLTLAFSLFTLPSGPVPDVALRHAPTAAIAANTSSFPSIYGLRLAPANQAATVAAIVEPDVVIEPDAAPSAVPQQHALAPSLTASLFGSGPPPINGNMADVTDPNYGYRPAA